MPQKEKKMKPERNKNKSEGPKQGHKLVWATAIIILIPCVLVGYVLIASMGGQNKPVLGSRFGKGDLTPEIEKSQMDDLEKQMLSISGVEEATLNLKSATLRIHLNLVDESDEDEAQQAVEDAYKMVDDVLPIDEYFTNSDKGKMYDIEIDGYNFLVDDDHPQEDQAYVKLTKTGSGKKVIDVMTKAKNPELSKEVQK